METLSLEALRYSEYKATGYEWIGEIPLHWRVEKGKWLFKKEDRLPKVGDGIVTAFRDGQVTLRSNRREDGFTNAIQEHGYQRIQKGDLVIHAMDAFAGAIGVSDSDGKSSPVYSACTARKSDTVYAHYYAYLLRNLAKTGFIESLAKGIRERSTDFRYKDFGLLELPFPPLAEQTAIANFLNKKTAQIDKAIAQKERLIELLKERRQILVHKAVTRGLYPDVKMKDSGVEWIGEVPQHWEVKKVKHFSSIRSGDSIVNTKLKEEGLYEVFGGNGFMGFYDKYNVNEEKIIIGRVGALCGNVKLINEAKWISDNALILTLKKGESYSYFSVLLSVADLNKLNSSNAQPLITGTKVMNFFLPIPPKSEQRKIEDFINVVSLKSSIALQYKEQEIEKLKEYKATLINAAVSGKIKVSA